MKTANKFLLSAIALGTAATLLVAQDNQPPGGGQGRPSGGQQGGPGGQGSQGGRRFGGGQGGMGQRPHMPLIEALDANHDGVIDATEIANASAALKKLDKNGDGKLTRDEFLGQPPGGQGGQGGFGRGGGPGGQGGPNGGQQQGERQRPKSE